LSRVRIVGLLFVLVALATALAACGSDDDPGQVLDSAGLEDLKSGKLDLSFRVKSEGREGGNLDVNLSGPFLRRGQDLPELDLTVTVEGTADGEAVDLEGGLTLLSNRGFLNYKGVEYEIDPNNFRLVKSSFVPPDPDRGKESGVSALSTCQEAAASLDLSEFVDNPTNDGSVDVDGTETTRISGDLDVSAAFDAIVELAEDPSCDAQLAAAGRSADDLKKVDGELTGAVQKARAEIYIGDDGIVRKIVGELTAEPKGGGQDEVEANFELTLSEVNEDPEIKAPFKAKPILLWFERLGVSPFEALFLVSEPEGLGSTLELIAADLFPAIRD
jgi:hypothetical protein